MFCFFDAQVTNEEKDWDGWFLRLGSTEDKQMEQGFDTFWESGKISDYLAYCTAQKQRDVRQERQKEVSTYGTIRDTDRNGFDFHAGGRI